MLPTQAFRAPELAPTASLTCMLTIDARAMRTGAWHGSLARPRAPSRLDSIDHVGELMVTYCIVYGALIVILYSRTSS